MKVRVRLFAALREIVGREELEVDLAPGTTVSGLWEKMAGSNSRLAPYGRSIQFAVNRDFVPRETELSSGDEVAFLPPVSGG